jgi:hypothetical protein
MIDSSAIFSVWIEQAGGIKPADNNAKGNQNTRKLQV